ncbi:Abi family protein [Pediococcus acidilactici]|uniref:Abi family protein n=1 Tax=Pediococcus acidilactici TaxID=1254 RepID=UPI00155DEBBE|nr:Abi family protein [Pediococcus acidilactici]NRD13572.1 Abi family protein [Pediococcus acidilactici]
MEKPKQLSYIDQLCLLKLRGITGINMQISGMNNSKSGIKKRKELDKNIHTIKSISYYELKRYAYPFYNRNIEKYKGLDFRELIARYYRDKKFRQEILYAIEDMEVALNTSIAYVLGEKTGAFGYLDFSKWCQVNSKNKFLKNNMMNQFAIEQERLKFLSSLQFKVKKSSMLDIKEYVNNNTQIFPPVWLMVNVLTLGDSIHIIKLMSKRNRENVANNFNCTVKELISWFECLNLIRNICCHNGNLIDFELRTAPIVPEKFKDNLFSTNDGFTKRIAIVIAIIITIMNSINSKYYFGRLRNSINKFVNNDDYEAVRYGFKDSQAMMDLFN